MSKNPKHFLCPCSMEVLNPLSLFLGDILKGAFFREG
jgi:hypothetical protein